MSKGQVIIKPGFFSFFFSTFDREREVSFSSTLHAKIPELQKKIIKVL